MFRRAFRDFPGRLHVVAGGPEAIASMRTRPPALVLINARSPGVVDGLLNVLSEARRVQELPLPIHVFGPPLRGARIRDMYRSCSAYTVIAERRDRFESLVRSALDYWLNRALLPPPPHGAGALDLRDSPSQR